jgi:quercetin dioxygenase-like cupin family protein
LTLEAERHIITLSRASGAGFEAAPRGTGGLIERTTIVHRRDLLMACLGAAVAVSCTTGVWARTAAMSSRVFDWTSFTAQPTKVGAVRRVVQEPTATLDELEIHITTLNPGQTPHAPHKHPAEELIVIKEGTVEALVNGETRRVGPGSIVFQASNQMHTIRNVGDGPATYHVIQWQSPGMLKR